MVVSESASNWFTVRFLNFKEGDQVKKVTILLSGIRTRTQSLLMFLVRFLTKDIEEGVTMSEQVDPVTGFATKVITDSKGAEAKSQQFGDCGCQW